MASHASEVALVSVTQVKPGEVTARVSYTGASALRASELTLRLDADHAVAAADVASAPVAESSAALLLCLDRSGSMRDPAIVAMQSALRDSLAARAGAAQLPFSVAIITFGTHTNHLLGLTNDPARVVAAVAKLGLEHERDGKTKLHDAVAGALAELRNIDATSKRILVVSDGNDEGSDLSQAALIGLAAATPAVAIDAVGFGPLAASSSGSLMTLAGATRGRFTSANTGAELTAALAHMVRQAVSAPQFNVTFRYPAVADGRASQAPSLAYKPQSGAAADWSVGTSLAAAAVAPVVAATAQASQPAAHDDAGSSWRRFLQLATIERFAATVPLFAWIAFAILLIALIAIFIFMRRRRRVDQAPVEQSFGETTRSPTRHVATTIVRPSLAVQPTVAPPPPSERRNTIVSFRWPALGDGRPVAVLHIASGAAKGRRFKITMARVRIGSAGDNELLLEGDDFVSSHHAIVRVEANGLFLVDLGSLNGTDLNGARFKDSTRSLSPGDRFTVGRTALEVETAEASRGGDRSGFEQRVR